MCRQEWRGCCRRRVSGAVAHVSIGLLQAKLRVVPGGSFVASFAGVAHVFHFEEEAGDRIRLTIDGKVVMLEKEKDPSVLTAPYAGKLTRYVVEDGAHLSRGDAYAEVEVMKMLFLLTTSEAGMLHLTKVAGSFVDAGEKLATLTLDDPSLVAKASPFDGDLGDFDPPLELQLEAGPAHQQLGYLVKRVHNMLDGFVDNEEEVISRLSDVLLNPEVMLHEWTDLMAGVGSKLPQAPREELAALRPSATTEAFGGTVLGILLKYEASLAPDEALSTAFRQQAELLYSFGQRFKSSSLDYATVIVGEIIDHFLAVEGHYPDDRSELSGADAASGAALCGEFGSMHRVGSMEACIAWGAGGACIAWGAWQHASCGERGRSKAVPSPRAYVSAPQASTA